MSIMRNYSEMVAMDLFATMWLADTSDEQTSEISLG